MLNINQNAHPITKRVMSALTPGYYRLGMWRVEYMQQMCCVCGTYPANHIPNNHLTSAGMFKQNQFNKNSRINHTLKNNYKFKNSPSILGSSLLKPTLLCQSCHDDLIWLPPPLNLHINFNDDNDTSSPTLIDTGSVHINVQPATYHQGYLRASLIAFKHLESLNALPMLVHALRQLPRPKGHHASNSIILAMPTTRMRLRKRGFDPLAVLVHYLAKHWQIPVWQGVGRIDNAISQQGLNRSDRRLNISHAFQLNTLPPTKRIIIFDDVVTTGTTLKALIRFLYHHNPHLQLSAYTISSANS